MRGGFCGQPKPHKFSGKRPADLETLEGAGRVHGPMACVITLWLLTGRAKSPFAGEKRRPWPSPLSRPEGGSLSPLGPHLEGPSPFEVRGEVLYPKAVQKHLPAPQRRRTKALVVARSWKRGEGQLQRFFHRSHPCESHTSNLALVVPLRRGGRGPRVAWEGGSSHLQQDIHQRDLPHA